MLFSSSKYVSVMATPKKLKKTVQSSKQFLSYAVSVKENQVYVFI